MKLNQKAIGLALGIISGLAALLCTIFIAVLPVQTMKFFGWLIHMNKLADIVGPREVTLGNGIIGIIAFFVFGYVTGWLFAVLYNKFAKETQS